MNWFHRVHGTRQGSAHLSSITLIHEMGMEGLSGRRSTGPFTCGTYFPGIWEAAGLGKSYSKALWYLFLRVENRAYLQIFSKHLQVFLKQEGALLPSLGLQEGREACMCMGVCGKSLERAPRPAQVREGVRSDLSRWKKGLKKADILYPSHSLPTVSDNVSSASVRC